MSTTDQLHYRRIRTRHTGALAPHPRLPHRQPPIPFTTVVGSVAIYIQDMWYTTAVVSQTVAARLMDFLHSSPSRSEPVCALVPHRFASVSLFTCAIPTPGLLWIA